MNRFSLDVGVGDFDEKVVSASRRVPVLVDFWAEWCAPCRLLKPVLEKLAAEYGGRFILARLNSDLSPELATRYAVRSIPSVKAFVNGEVIKEFTGALPEARIRAFIDSLMPSPAEPLRLAALEARARGDAEVACALLADAAQLDPASEMVQLDLAEIHIDMQQLDAARAILGALEHTARDDARARVLQARLNLAANTGNADIAALEGRVAANADDLDGRLQLAAALALTQDYRRALEQLLDLVRRDRKWQDEAARKAMLDLFALLGSDPQYDDVVHDFRIRLARTLN